MTDPGQWRRVVLLLFAVAFGTNVSTPLLVLYRERLHLSPAVVTSIFAVYAAGLMLALLLAGPASDRLGRRPVVLPFAALAALASVLFLPAADATPLLFVARFLQGFVSGAVFSVGSAWLREVAPAAPVNRSARRASIAMNAGFSLGPLSAGLLAEYGPAPTVTPYVVHVALALAALALILPVPETVRTRARGPMLRLRLPPASRRPFLLLLVPTALPIFAYPATAATVLPFLLDDSDPKLAVAGLIAGVVLGVAVLVAPAAHPLGSHAAPVGCAVGTVGLLLAIVASHGSTWLPLVPVAALLGVGSGLCLPAGLALAERLSTDESRGAVYAAFYAVAYSGFGVPVLITLIYGERLATPLAALAASSAVLGAWLMVARHRVPVVTA